MRGRRQLSATRGLKGINMIIVCKYNVAMGRDHTRVLVLFVLFFYCLSFYFDCYYSRETGAAWLNLKI